MPLHGVESTESKTPLPSVNPEAKGKPVEVEPLLDDKVHTDVCFVLGKDQSVKIEAHRALLAQVSKVFESMLAPPPGTVKNLQTIELPDMSADVFQAMLDCIYTGDTKRITPENFAACFEAANRYQVTALQIRITSYLESGEHLTPKSIVDVLSRFQLVDGPEAEQVWTYLEQNAQVLTQHPSFVEMPSNILRLLLQRSYLSCSEYDLFKAVLSWGEAEAKRQGLSEKPEDVRKVLSDVLPFIRFPTMTADQFLDVALMGILTKEEMTAVKTYIASQSSSSESKSDDPEGAGAAKLTGKDNTTSIAGFSTVSRGHGTMHHIQSQENRFRAMFAKGIKCGEEADKLLINVYNNDKMFLYPSAVEFDRPSIPIILASKRAKAPTGPAINSLEAFHCAFYHLTLGMLEGLNWAHICVAGGSITAVLQRDEKIQSEVESFLESVGAEEDNEEDDDENNDDNNQQQQQQSQGRRTFRRRRGRRGGRASARPDDDDGSADFDGSAWASYPRKGNDKHLVPALVEYIHCANMDDGFTFEDPYGQKVFPFRGTDIDLFIYGTDAKVALEKIRHVYETMRKNMTQGEEILIVRTSHAITFVPPWPRPHVQCILRCYQSISEVLLGFDLDAVCNAFDGASVYSTHRGRHALRMRMNVVDATRQSTTYESRLYKYNLRGFAVGVPHFQPERLDLSIFARPLSELRGLARLLRLNAIMTECNTSIPEHRAAALGDSDYCTASPWLLSRPYFDNTSSIIQAAEQFNSSGMPVPFYHCIGRTHKSIDRILDATKLSDFSATPTADVKASLRKHFAALRRGEGFFRGDMLIAVPVAPAFITDDPGRQYSGSFHPLSGDWFQDAYKPKPGKAGAKSPAAKKDDVVVESKSAGDASPADDTTTTTTSGAGKVTTGKTPSKAAEKAVDKGAGASFSSKPYFPSGPSRRARRFGRYADDDDDNDDDDDEAADFNDFDDGEEDMEDEDVEEEEDF